MPEFWLYALIAYLAVLGYLVCGVVAMFVLYIYQPARFSDLVGVGAGRFLVALALWFVSVPGAALARSASAWRWWRS